MAQLILQHSQQIRNDIQPLRQQFHPLIHLQITPHGGINRLQLRFYPEKFGRVEYRAVEVDVDAENEEFANLHVDLFAGESDLAGQRNLGGDLFAGIDSCVDKFFE